MTRTPKIGVVKIGCIASATLLEYALDERAERDIEVRSWSTGAKMDSASCAEVTERAIESSPDLLLIVSPNATLEGPTLAREKVAESGIPCIAISDAPSMKAFVKKTKDGETQINLPDSQGFIVVTSDSMIGARREFLDATEMVLFNADALRVLASCGVARGITSEIDKVIGGIRTGRPLSLPRTVMNTDRALEHSGLTNPYAKAKAIAALRIAEQVASITSEACFRVSNPKEYVMLAAAGHEMMRAAAKLADEIRELEKAGDTLLRSPHADDGSLLSKSKLNEKPR
jgi:methylenetetrahydromethanopterin dehydrogenase